MPYTNGLFARGEPRMHVYKLRFDEEECAPYTPFWHGSLCTTIWEHPDLDFITCRMMAAYQVAHFCRFGNLHARGGDHFPRATENAERLLMENVTLYQYNPAEITKNVLWLGTERREVPVYRIFAPRAYYAVDVVSPRV